MAMLSACIDVWRGPLRDIKYKSILRLVKFRHSRTPINLKMAENAEGNDKDRGWRFITLHY